ncbi:MAG: UDP-N-acetylmuramoyl-L-alanyl-D-glutamate--2,6-diaminopimelate ligase, partial [Erysipelotrichaceae bacterium]|nr:UDP-N-acetylmuramoyl-L-alanyl-D-glutamate--2,6-diaminopimelate ligase [Erysipelotrichaceae bacterium]
IITEDDPRDEKPEEIAKEIKSGIHNINSLIVTNRANAIEMAVDLMEDGDTLLILGKGDERFIYREFGKEYYDGDDVIVTEAIKKYLEERE